MLIRHYWRYIQTHDLSADQMNLLERCTSSPQKFHRPFVANGTWTDAAPILLTALFD